MKSSLEKAALPSLGASAAVTVLNCFSDSERWGIGDFVLNLMFMYVVTLVAVALILWLTSYLKGRRKKTEQ